MPRYLIIDGYNVISKIKQIEAKKDSSLELARLYLIKKLDDFMGRKDVFDKVLIVFDSKREGPDIRRESYGRIKVLFSTKDKDADGVIVDLLKNAAAGDNISVCSDDNFVRNHTRAFGRESLSVKELEDIIMLNKKRLGSKMKNIKDLENGKIKDINEELKKHWGIE